MKRVLVLALSRQRKLQIKASAYLLGAAIGPCATTSTRLTLARKVH
jgi:hypothetical protein